MHATTLTPAAPTITSHEKRIPRPPNAFILYRSAKWEEAKADGSADALGTMGQASKVFGQMWKLEPPEVREDFEERARRAAEAHREKHPDYHYCPRSKAKKEAEQRIKREAKARQKLERAAAKKAAVKSRRPAAPLPASSPAVPPPTSPPVLSPLGSPCGLASLPSSSTPLLIAGSASSSTATSPFPSPHDFLLSEPPYIPPASEVPTLGSYPSTFWVPSQAPCAGIPLGGPQDGHPAPYPYQWPQLPLQPPPFEGYLPPWWAVPPMSIPQPVGGPPGSTFYEEPAPQMPTGYGNAEPAEPFAIGDSLLLALAEHVAPVVPNEPRAAPSS